ncbi:hypothetical protein [Acaryochloris sp. CCMEE 5410]|uniref:hypothetical protein n=1 Tax=Acaryochloris sp. CCMEE 5410 TaxID=310037 RepID=UPI00024843D7|nr:hypothetical protein [Acaryochloris sp. CCMEE 5410]KAI9129937.1 hypothetical protein ON05_030185 [Acaryochloris sp. CCMEE 5410]
MFKILTKTVVTGTALLALTVSPLLAQTVSEPSSNQTKAKTEKPTTPEQMRQHHQRMLGKMQKMMEQMQQRVSQMTPEQIRLHHEQMMTHHQKMMGQMQMMKKQMGQGKTEAHQGTEMMQNPNHQPEHPMSNPIPTP